MSLNAETSLAEADYVKTPKRKSKTVVGVEGLEPPTLSLQGR